MKTADFYQITADAFGVPPLYIYPDGSVKSVIKNKAGGWGDQTGTIRLRKEILCRQWSRAGGVMLASWPMASAMPTADRRACQIEIRSCGGCARYR